MRTIIESKKIQEKRQQESRVVEEMIRAFCKSRHRSGSKLCSECEELLQYAKTRSSRCPFMDKKTFCSNCKVHCYKPDMREKIRSVMRDRGLWMLIHHPILSIKHILATIKEKKELEKI
ncbi:MAG: nitrous oxide-stimulated promoter family protein [Peptostreptococcaceae bacterium]|nr:nitrous oxide-stimulated promoter family protein [Peptostreptococcaceae bacterium]